MQRLTREPSLRIAILAAIVALGAASLSAQEETTRACAAGASSEAASEAARRCAEEFVARNGYTLASPASDTLLLVVESIEREASWADRLAERRGTLLTPAISSDCTDLGCTVIFDFAPPAQCAGRAVTMTAQFTQMQVQHRDIVKPACR